MRNVNIQSAASDFVVFGTALCRGVPIHECRTGTARSTRILSRLALSVLFFVPILCSGYVQLAGFTSEQLVQFVKLCSFLCLGAWHSPPMVHRSRNFQLSKYQKNACDQKRSTADRLFLWHSVTLSITYLAQRINLCSKLRSNQKLLISNVQVNELHGRAIHMLIEATIYLSWHCTKYVSIGKNKPNTCIKITLVFVKFCGKQLQLRSESALFRFQNTWCSTPKLT